MPKQQITIEVDIPDGYEATGEFRSPGLDEVYLQRGEVKRSRFDHYASDFVIVRKKWQWPDWLKAPWIAMDKNGEWYAYKEQPDLMDCFVTWQSSGPSSLVLIDCLLFDFTPPECTDWKQSLRKNPNAL